MSYKILVFTLLFSIVACGGPEQFQDQNKNRTQRMSAEERNLVAPNELFIAVLDGNMAEVQSVLEKSPSLKASKNQSTGNTPLGLALELGEFRIAEVIFENSTVEDFFITNHQGEGLIFQAARAGMVSIIEKASDRYFQSLGVFNDYEFRRLDLENHLGQRALHVAKNSQVAEALKVQYYRGFLEFPFWEFTFKRDLQDKNFLHTAALDGRHDLLRWAAAHLCENNEWEETGGWIKGTLGFLYHRTQRGIQTYIGGLGLDYDLKFNQKDSFGKAPLHYAAHSRNLETLRLISSCQWTDYTLKDSDGNTALQNFLLAIPEETPVLSESDLQSLNFLLSQQTLMKKWIRLLNEDLNSVNYAGESALHLAARLSDPRVYQMLSERGDVEKKNSLGLSAREIFESKQKRVQSYVR